ncbi:PKD domain-containing protein, partial [Arthrospira platensis SPKY1]|nr:PKD domain-containing protein [Arthrospira platensis SPKY1]
MDTQFDTALPWFAGYVATGETLSGHNVYQRFFPGGSLVSMGENRNASGGHGFNIYHIVVDYTPPPPNQPPVASLTASPLVGDPPMLVQFDASASSDADGQIVRYDWDFGDGTVLSDGAAQVQ